ncbi:MAG: helix-turn-helix domain-containing protein [Oscillospiraceae bacterium]|nr:helix-turn-helix domain-containing protein [Oscillospiraceae bacterium]
MDGTQLGKKLKEARLAKKMTQSDVVGTFITRNMLSQIESGAASPSLRTLEYLANTLQIPVHYLVSEEVPNQLRDESSPFAIQTTQSVQESKSEHFLQCKAAFLRGDYDYVLDKAHELESPRSSFYDECAAILARSYLKMSERLTKEREYKTAISYARLAARYGDIGIYASREVRTEALLLLDELSETAQ